MAVSYNRLYIYNVVRIYPKHIVHYDTKSVS